MIGFVGQYVMFGKEALTPCQTSILQIDNVELRNDIVKYFNVTRNVTNAKSYTIPIEWSVETIMNCDFADLNAGNLQGVADNVTKILVKRQRIDIVGQPWVTLFEIPINNQEELSFVIEDFTAINGATYNYMLVPVFMQQQGDKVIEIEGIGEVSQDVMSNFEGVFICSRDNFYKLYAGVSYGDMTSTQITGVHQTLGSKYPIVVINSNVGYNSGSLTGTVLNEDYGQETLTGHQGLDRKKIVEAQNKLRSFMQENTPKIIKDWNGNAWLVVLTDDVSTSFLNEWGMGLANVSTNWTEIGDVEDEQSLRNAGFVGGVQ